MPQVGVCGTRRLGHGPVRHVGVLGFGYSLFLVFVGFCVIRVVGIIYLAWPYLLGALVVIATLVLVSRTRR